MSGQNEMRNNDFGEDGPEQGRLSKCWNGFSHCMYHDGLYCGNPASNWAKILTAFAILWTGVGLFFYAMITITLEYGVDALWGYLVCFGIAVSFIAVAVILGTIKNKKEEEEARKHREQQERDANAQLGFTTTVSA